MVDSPDGLPAAFCFYKSRVFGKAGYAIVQLNTGVPAETLSSFFENVNAISVLV